MDPLISGKCTSSDTPPSPSKDPENEHYFQCASLSLSQILIKYNTTLSGLSSDSVSSLREKYGINDSNEEEKCPALRQFLNAILNPFNILLTIISVLIYYSGDDGGCIIVLSMIILSSLTTFIQEYRSSNAVKKLQMMISSNVIISRKKPKETLVVNIDLPNNAENNSKINNYTNTSEKETFGEEAAECESVQFTISTKELVPGDVVILSAGDMIPADIRLISSNFLNINQASMTGESMAVEKTTGCTIDKERVLFDYPNLIFQGTNVISGSAKGIVISTGKHTIFGKMKGLLSKPKEKTAFDQGINNYIYMICSFMVGLGLLTFFINTMVNNYEYSEAIEFSLAVAVGMLPEMLPMIITVNLAKGAIEMSKKDVIVKKLTAIQNIGAMDVLCIDKTGTLTDDIIRMENSYDHNGDENHYPLEVSYYISSLQTGLKNYLDEAILEKVEGDFREFKEKLGDLRKIAELPFDFERRCMSVVVNHSLNPKTKLLLCKGAAEEILSKSKFFVHSRFSKEQSQNTLALSDHVESLTIEKTKEIAQKISDFNSKGLRVIAVGYSQVPNESSSKEIYEEKDLIFLGFLAFHDPPKPSTIELIKKLTKKGLTIKVLTGDNPLVTRYICKQVGIQADLILTGQEIRELPYEILSEKVQSISVFAKLTPQQKELIVKTLQKRGHIVGFMGDGINDTLALKAADCSISVDNAVDITKQCANIILLKKNLEVLANGVEEGRKTFGNVVKYLKMAAAASFGNVFSIAGSAFLFSFLPITAIQLLILTLLYDISQCGIPFDSVDSEYIATPRRWEIMDIVKFMVIIGPISSIFDYTTWGVTWYFFGNHGETTEEQTQFQTSWFIEGLMAQTLVVHVIRTHKIPFFESRASWILIGTTGLVLVMGLGISYTWLAEYVPFVPPPTMFYPFLVAILIVYVFMTQIGKHFYYKYNGLK